MSSRNPPKKPRRGSRGTEYPKAPEEREAATTPNPRQNLQSLMDSSGGMMALPESIAKGRQVQVEPGRAPQSARARWNKRPLSDEVPTVASFQEPAIKKRSVSEEMPTFGHFSTPPPNQPNRALTRSQQISITETAVSAMPSTSRDLWLLHERDGVFASNVRILATRIEKIKETFGYKSYLMSSVGSGDGKTVTATNLALAMSEDSDRKVALVDANFRNPRVADLFNLGNTRGLLSAIAGEYRLSECIARVTGRNLILMTSGGTHANPAHVLSDPRFKSLIADLSQSVDYMFIDAPAAMPHADVPLLAQSVDAVIMVVARSRTQSMAYDRAISAIGKKRIVGNIFIDVPPKRRRAG